ncbi:PREDICTED: uncharacterized protein LOC101314624 [Fragaria vesca subsp. vesca]
MKISILSLAAVLIFYFQLASVNANLIDDECPKTPKPNVCFSSLNPYYRTHDPPSVRELAIVMGSTVLVNKVYATIDKINELIKEMPSYQVLRKCAFNFQIIRDNKITEFRGSFVKSDYGAAASALSSIVPLADGCSSPLSKGYSDLIDLCTDVSNTAIDAATIVKNIPK